MSIGNSATLQIGIEIKDDGSYTLKKLRTETDRTARDGKRAFKDMGRGVDGFTRSLSSSMTSLLKIGAGVGGFLAIRSAIRGLISTGQEWVALAGIQESAEKNLETVLKATGHAAGYNLDQLKAMASGMQTVTTVGDEVILNAQAMLATFKNVRGEGFERATMAALDMSQVMGQDLKSSIVQIGKALNDPIQGMTALNRVGVTFTEQQKDQVKALQKSGKAVEAQGIILKELESQFGGAAKAARETFPGIVEAVKNAAGDMQEDLGRVIGENDDLIDAFKELESWIKDNAPLMAQNFADAIGPIMTGMINMAKAVGKVTSFSLKVLADAQKRAREGHYEFIGTVEKDTIAAGGEMASIIQGGAEELERNLKELADRSRIENEDLTQDRIKDTEYLFDRMRREGELYYEEQDDLNASLIASTRYTTDKMIDASRKAAWETAQNWREGYEQIGRDQKTLFDAWKDAWADAIKSPETTYEVIKELTVDFVKDASDLLGDGISAAFQRDMDALQDVAKEGLEDLGTYIGQISGSIFGPVGAAIGGAIGKSIGEALGEAFFGEETKYAEVGAAIAGWTSEGFIASFTPTGSDRDEWGSRLAKELNESLAGFMTPFNETFLQAIEINHIPGIDGALNDFQTKFVAIYNSGFEGFTISEQGNWQEDFEQIMAHIQTQWDAGVREMLATVGFESYEAFQAYVEKMNAMIEMSAGTIGSAFKKGLDSGDFNAFEVSLYDSVYDQILDAMITALMQSELFRQALVPFYQSMEDAMNSLYDPAVFQQKMTDAVGVLKSGVGALQPQFESMNQTIAAVKSMLGIGAERGSTDVPSLDVGTYNVSDAGLAYLHKYEMVVPADVAGPFRDLLERGDLGPGYDFSMKDPDATTFGRSFTGEPTLPANITGKVGLDALIGMLFGGPVGAFNGAVGALGREGLKAGVGYRGMAFDIPARLGQILGGPIGGIVGPLAGILGDSIGDLTNARSHEPLRDMMERNFGYKGGRLGYAESFYDKIGTPEDPFGVNAGIATFTGVFDGFVDKNKKSFSKMGIDVEALSKENLAEIARAMGYSETAITGATYDSTKSIAENVGNFSAAVNKSVGGFTEHSISAVNAVDSGFAGFGFTATEEFGFMEADVVAVGEKFGAFASRFDTATTDMIGLLETTETHMAEVVNEFVGVYADAAEAANEAAANATAAAEAANEGADRIGTQSRAGVFEPGTIGTGDGGIGDGEAGSIGTAGDHGEGYGSDVDNDSRGGGGYSYAHGSWYTPRGRSYVHEGEIIVERPNADMIRGGKAAVIDEDTLSLLRSVIAQNAGGGFGGAVTIPITVITPDGRQLQQKTVKMTMAELKKRSKNGEIVIHAKGVA